MEASEQVEDIFCLRLPGALHSCTYASHARVRAIKSFRQGVLPDSKPSDTCKGSSKHTFSVAYGVYAHVQYIYLCHRVSIIHKQQKLAWKLASTRAVDPEKHPKPTNDHPSVPKICNKKLLRF